MDPVVARLDGGGGDLALRAERGCDDHVLAGLEQRAVGLDGGHHRNAIGNDHLLLAAFVSEGELIVAVALAGKTLPVQRARWRLRFAFALGFAPRFVGVAMSVPPR